MDIYTILFIMIVVFVFIGLPCINYLKWLFTVSKLNKKLFRIVKISDNYYRVDQLHHILFLPYWDLGASDLCPNYRFENVEDARKAILDLIVEEDIEKEE